MKAYIRTLLVMWGRWAIKRDSGALGYPSMSSGFQEYVPVAGETYSSREIASYTSADILAIDRAITVLPSILKLTIVEVYQRGGSIRTVAGRMGISDKTLAKYLLAAHEQLTVDLEIQFPQNPSQLDRVKKCAPEKPATAK